MKKKSQGLTLIELLTALAIAGILVAALSSAFSASVRYQVRAPQAREQVRAQVAVEDGLRNVLEHAYVDQENAAAVTYFVGRSDPGSESTLGSGESATEVVFTALGMRLPGSVLGDDSEMSFEDRNRTHGPSGGLVEVRLGLTPIGDAGSRTGLFIREQNPPDEDVDQGGYERVLDDRIQTISFEFWDGNEWVAEWDTRTGERRIPAAIRITYSLASDSESRKAFVVQLKNSDVTTANPATIGGGP